MIKQMEIFNKNIQFSLYGRSGSIVRTRSIEINEYLKECGWVSCCKKGIYRLNPPTINLVDIIDPEKAEQYQNIIFNYTLYQYFQPLNYNNMLEQYCNKVIKENEILFKDFSFHISVGPVLGYTIKIEGCDKRIYKLKTYLILNMLNDFNFIKLYNQNTKKFKKSNYFIQKENISEENINIQKKYIKKYNANTYKAKEKEVKVNYDEIQLNDFDYIIFILNGCFKILPYFDLKGLENKIIFWEIHVDKTKGIDKCYNIEKLKNKKVLIVDSIYSGKTILYVKEKLKLVTPYIKILGTFPKNDNVAGICDYNLILNKVVKKKSGGVNIEKEILSILGG